MLLEQKKHKEALLYNERIQTSNEDDYEYKKIKQELQIEDLKRYGIFTYLVND